MRTELYAFPAGEENKNLDTVRSSLHVSDRNAVLHRKDCLIALGGGVAGDLTGFAAATYLQRELISSRSRRPFWPRWTAASAERQGVDFDGYKNMVGAFHMPALVYMNLSTLDDPGGEAVLQRFR